MAEQVELEIAPREAGSKVSKKLRREGIIPANIFGHGQPSQSVQVPALAFERLRRLHQATGMIRLKLPDAAIETALIRKVQHDPRSGHVIHIDFFRVNLSERIGLKVALHFEGEAPAVKNLNGVLLHLLDTLEVECVASEIIDFIAVDVSSLSEIDASLLARDIKLPEGYKLITDPEEAVVKVAGTRAEKIETTTDAVGAATPATPEAKA